MAVAFILHIENERGGCSVIGDEFHLQLEEMSCMAKHILLDLGAMFARQGPWSSTSNRASDWNGQKVKMWQAIIKVTR